MKKLGLIWAILAGLFIQFTSANIAEVEPQIEENYLAFYDYEPKPVDYSFDLIKETREWRKYELRFPSLVSTGYPENDRVFCFYFEPKNEGEEKAPAIIVLHGWGAIDVRSEEQLGQLLCRDGFVAVIFMMPYHLKRRPKGRRAGEYMVCSDIEKMLQSYRQAVIDIRCLLDWLERKPEVDKERLGIVGISLGAVVANLVMGVDERLKAGVSVLGGGNVAKIIWRSLLGSPVRHQLKRRGLSQEEVEKKLAVIDPITFAGRNQPRKVLMLNGIFDLIMPRSCVEDLWQALGEPKIEWFWTGHYGFWLIKDIILKKTVDFLEEQLSKVNSSSENAKN